MQIFSSTNVILDALGAHKGWRVINSKRRWKFSLAWPERAQPWGASDARPPHVPGIALLLLLASMCLALGHKFGCSDAHHTYQAGHLSKRCIVVGSELAKRANFTFSPIQGHSRPPKVIPGDSSREGKD